MDYIVNGRDELLRLLANVELSWVPITISVAGTNFKCTLYESDKPRRGKLINRIKRSPKYLWRK